MKRKGIRLRARAASRDQSPRQKLGELNTWDYGFLVQGLERFFRAIMWLAGSLALGGSLYLMRARPEYAIPFLVITLAGWACLTLWFVEGRQGIPVLPLFVVQQMFFYGFPIIFQNPSLEGQTAGVVGSSAWTIVLFLFMLSAGWWLGVRFVRSSPSLWNFHVGDEVSAWRRGLTLALLFLVVSLAFHLANVSGRIFKILPAQTFGFIPVIRTFAGAAAAMGAFLGGLVTAGRAWQTGKVVFWILVAGNFFLSISDILISAASALVVSCAIGLGLGLRRFPWRFLGVMGLLVAFLNQGKFVMREKYWDQQSNSKRVGLRGLPTLYTEWTKASFGLLTSANADPSQAVNSESGQSLLERVNGLQNLTFIVDALKRNEAELLYGSTYTIIPALLMPRFLWPDKPRTHVGQVMLNLNFGRQQTTEETYRTYIAWGLLPEAVGNFGCVGGACFLGIFAGLACGLLEAWSARKRLFSVGGLIAGALLIQIAVSYEMVASVFVTATFQLLVAVFVGGLFIRWWFAEPSALRLHRPRLRRVVRPTASAANGARFSRPPARSSSQTIR